MGTRFRETFHFYSFRRRIHKRAWTRGFYAQRSKSFAILIAADTAAVTEARNFEESTLL